EPYVRIPADRLYNVFCRRGTGKRDGVLPGRELADRAAPGFTSILRSLRAAGGHGRRSRWVNGCPDAERRRGTMGLFGASSAVEVRAGHYAPADGSYLCFPSA